MNIVARAIMTIHAVHNPWRLRCYYIGCMRIGRIVKNRYLAGQFIAYPYPGDILPALIRCYIFHLYIWIDMPVDSRLHGCKRAAGTDFEEHVYRPFAVVLII